MEFWEALWKGVFWVGLSAFAVMAVWVTIAGFLDIRRLLRTMREQHAEEVEEGAPPAPSSRPVDSG